MTSYPRMLFTLMLLGTTTPLWSQNTRDTCTVTYIANEGFLIETKNHKVLIDALFGNIKGNWCDQPGDSILTMMIHGMPPFADVDVVLVTHKHRDHFNARMVVEFLENNLKPVLICPSQVDELLQQEANYPRVAGRVCGMRSDHVFDVSLNVNNMVIRVMRFAHGAYFETDSISGSSYDIHRDVENFGYLIEADGFKALHTGDGTPSNRMHFAEYGFDATPVDMVFVDRTFLRREGLDLIGRAVDTKNLIFMHAEPGRAEYYRSVVSSIPEMFVFVRPLETRTIIK